MMCTLFARDPACLTACECNDCNQFSPSCPDGFCSGGETCSDCAQDCGPCQESCGDGQCTGAEDCTNCPADCDATCDDGVACTVDACKPDGSCENTPDDSLCGVSDTCATRSCHQDNGCETTFHDSVACDDDDICTKDEVCNGGTCEGGTPTAEACDDGVGCTLDECTANACSNTAQDSACDDSNLCTSDSCDAENDCQFVDITATCDDGNACTEDSCVPATGCENTVIADTCNDNDPCTVDVCLPAGGCSNDPVEFDCCEVPADCPASYSSDPVCDDAATCQGHEMVATCGVDNHCGTTQADNDSGCGTDLMVDECGSYAAAGCTGGADQSTPACATTCTDDNACDPTAACTNGACREAFCSLNGSVGEQGACPLNLARGAEAYDPAVIFLTTLTYNDSEVSDIQIYGCTGFPLDCANDAFCQALDAGWTCNEDRGKCEECKARPTSEAFDLPSGHTVQTCDVGGTCDPGKLIILIKGTASLPINYAYLDGGGTMVGDPEVIRVLFTQAQAGSVSVGYDATETSVSDSEGGSLAIELVRGTAPNPDLWFQTGQ